MVFWFLWSNERARMGTFYLASQPASHVAQTLRVRRGMFVCVCLEEESQDLSSQMFSSGLFVVHDATAGGQHNVTAIWHNKAIVNNNTGAKQ